MGIQQEQLYTNKCAQFYVYVGQAEWKNDIPQELIEHFKCENMVIFSESPEEAYQLCRQFSMNGNSDVWYLDECLSPVEALDICSSFAASSQGILALTDRMARFVYEIDTPLFIIHWDLSMGEYMSRISRKECHMSR